MAGSLVYDKALFATFTKETIITLYKSRLKNEQVRLHDGNACALKGDLSKIIYPGTGI